jgi:hypothetical protein
LAGLPTTSAGFLTTPAGFPVPPGTAGNVLQAPSFLANEAWLVSWFE